MFQYCSDLHLEFKENAEYIESIGFLKKRADILILAGDIHYFNGGDLSDPFFDYVSENFEQVLLVPGNHEYYKKGELSNSYPALDRFIRPNVRIVNNKTIVLGNLRFVCSTMWSAINTYGSLITDTMNDYNSILWKGGRLNIEQVNKLHKSSVDFMEAELNKSFNGKTVVVTHHAPSIQCGFRESFGMPLLDAYYANLDELIEKYDIEAWVYGHNHHSIDPFKIGNCSMLTNQLGYVWSLDICDFDFGKYHSQL